MIAEERESASAQIRTMLNEQRKTIIAEYCEKVSHHELLAAQAEHERRILQEELLRQQQDFREVHQQDLIKMKELDRSSSRIRTLWKYLEDYKNCKMKWIVWMIPRIFRMLSRCAVEIHYVTSQPGVFPKHPPFEGLLRPSFILQRQTDGPPNIWDTSGISGNVFAHPQASSSAPYPQELKSLWKKTIEEPIHMSTAERSGRPERDQDLRCQSQPSAEDSVIFSGGDFSKKYGADRQRLKISDLHFC